MLGEGVGYLCLPLRMNYLLQAGASIRPEMAKPAFFPTLFYSSLSMQPFRDKTHNKYSSHHIPSKKEPRMWCEGKLKADFNYILAWRGFLCHQHQGVWNLGVTSRDVLLRHPSHLWFSHWLWIVNFVLTFSTLYISSISWVAGVKLIQCAK